MTFNYAVIRSPFKCAFYDETKLFPPGKLRCRSNISKYTVFTVASAAPIKCLNYIKFLPLQAK